MIETHPILNGFVPQNAQVLIVGTFPPKNEYLQKKDGFFFYSSEKNQFWNRIDNILNKHLKKTLTKNANESFIENKKRKESFAVNNNLGFIDVFSSVIRKANTSNDSDLIQIENIVQNGKLAKILESKNVKRICCTYKLAYECLKCNLGSLSKSIGFRKCPDSANGEIIYFDYQTRQIELVLLYPATRSRHKSNTKDDQYKKFLFEYKPCLKESSTG